ncbi:hypothetical protein COAQ111491_13830 [Comamonas aquatilis]
MASCSCCTHGIPWGDLPQSLGYGSGMTCWRRLRDCNASDVWQRLHQAMPVRLREHDQIDWNRACIEGSSVPSPWGQETGPNPIDRGKLGSKQHIVVDARGIPLVILVSGANRRDSRCSISVWMRYLRLQACQAEHANVSGGGASPAGLQGEVSRAVRNWVRISGLSREHTDGLRALASCESVLKGAWISTKRC